MRKIYTMKNMVKGLMLSALMTLGVATANAQETTETLKPADQYEFWMGEEAAAGDFYLYNVGANVFATNNTPSETDINNATLWTANEGSKGFSFNDNNGGYVIYMESIWSAGATWTTEITTKSGATVFTLANGTTTDKGNVYKFSRNEGWIAWKPMPTRYFNVDTDNAYKYTAAKTQGPCNDWLFISEAQKEAYAEYVSLFQKAASYLDSSSELYKSDDTAKIEEIVSQIKDALQSYNYTSYEESGKTKLEDAIKAAEDFINTTTGIHAINGTSEAKTAEIYGVNGARKSQLTKGLNIVKMSDGTVKKVLVK